MNKLYVVWSNYDGWCVERFDEEDKLLERVNELKLEEQRGDYGTSIEVVMYGKELELVSQEVKTMWRVR